MNRFDAALVEAYRINIARSAARVERELTANAFHELVMYESELGDLLDDIGANP